MDTPNSIFNKWVPHNIIISILLIALLPHLMILMMFNMNSTFTASFLDLEVDDIQFLFSLGYGMFVCGLFLHIRFFHYFNIRNYLLLMTMLNIVILFIMTLSINTQLLLVLRIIQCPIAIFEGCILYPILIHSIKGKNSRLITYSFLYGFMLTGDKFTTSIVKFAIENYNQNMILYTIIVLHVVALFIYVFFLNHNRMFPKIPLYQLNLPGVFLMMITLTSGAFMLIYGKKNYWFESPYIVGAFIICIVCAGLFILQQVTSKRPIYHFEVLKSKRVIAGVVMFFMFYLLRSSMSNIYQVMNVVWKWPWEYVLKIQYFNVAGSILGLYSAYQMVKRNVNFLTIFLIGFIILSSSMLYFSYIFLPDTRVEYVTPALFLEGVGQGVLFAPLVLYMLSSAKPEFYASVLQTGTAIRFWTTTISYSLLQNGLLYLTTKHQTYMTTNFDQSNSIFQNQFDTLFSKNNMTHLSDESTSLTVGTLKDKLANQALLISNIEIFRILFAIGFTVVIVLIIYKLYRFFITKKYTT